MRKIGIMGSHGTGKTSLVYSLAHRFKSGNPGMTVNIMPELARSCPTAINQNSDGDTHAWMFHRQMALEIEMRDCDILICDRTVLDCLAYTQHNGDHCMATKYLPIAIDYLRASYDVIYFLRPDINEGVADDGVRDIGKQYQMAIDRILKIWIDRYKISTIEREYIPV